jgi:hypothetical protein
MNIFLIYTNYKPDNQKQEKKYMIKEVKFKDMHVLKKRD